jgi:hypothetical protein
VRRLILKSEFNYPISLNLIISCVALLAIASATLVVRPAEAEGIATKYTAGNAFNSSSSVTALPQSGCTSSPVVTNASDSDAGSLRDAITNACPGSTITFDSTVFDPNSATQIDLANGELSINKNLTIAGPGAKILIVRNASSGVTANSRIFSITSGADVHISGLTVRDGSTLTNGGGISNAGTLKLLSCIVTSNNTLAALAGGGGIFNAGTLTIINSTISSNATLAGGGGGIFNAGMLSVTNSTISGNTSNGTGSGGGLSNTGLAATLINCTVAANNSPGSPGGGIDSTGGVMTLGNTIVADSTSADGSDLNGSFSSQGNNLIENPGASAAFFTSATHDQMGVDPKLAALSDNYGGQTPTHALFPGSPALDAGNNASLPQDTFDLDGDGNTTETLPFDQRGPGFIRVADFADPDTTATVDIGAFESQPLIEDIPDKQTNEDTPLPTFSFRIGESYLGTISAVTAASNNQQLVPDTNITLDGSSTTRMLSITPAPNQYGQATISVTVSETVGSATGSMTDTFVLTVVPVNDAPSFTEGTDQTVSEDAGPQTLLNWATHISPGPNEVGQALTFIVTGNTNPGLFATGPSVSSSGTLTYTPAANASGTASVTVVLKDNGGTTGGGVDTSAPQSFTITVSSVNDAPTLNAIADLTISEDATAQTVNLIGITAGGGESGQTLTVSAASSNPALVPNPTVSYTSPASTGSLSFSPAPDASGSTTITVTVKDSGGTANGGADTFTGTFNVTVTEVNDPPTGVNDTLSSVAEDSGPRTIAFSTLLANDSAGPASESSQTLTITGVSNAVGGTVQISGTNVLFTPAADYNGPAGFTYTLQDNGTTGGVNDFKTATATVSFQVTAVNDAPSFTKAANQTINEDAGAQSVASWATNISAGPPDESGQTLSFVVTNDNNALFSVQPALSASGTLIYTPAPDANGEASVTVALKDNGGTANGGVDTSAAQTLNITINAVNDAPVNTVPGAQSTKENRPLTFSTASSNAISISDIDAGANTVRVTLTLTNGTLTLGSVAELSFSAGDGVGDASMTFMGTITNINAALNGLVFTPSTDFDGSAMLTITTNDQGNTGQGGPLTDIDTLPITVVNVPTLAINDLSLPEGNSGTTNAAFTVTLSAPTADTVTVSYATANATATAPGDYQAASGTLTFNPGETTKTIIVLINGDTTDEPGETFFVNLSGVTNATIARAQGVCAIVNDDATTLQFGQSVYRANEADARAVITVLRTGDLSGMSTVRYVTSDPAGLLSCTSATGTASARCDYITVIGKLTFAPGQMSRDFTIPVVNDVHIEGPETFTVSLSNATGASLGAQSTATVTINDDDNAPGPNPIDSNDFFIRQHYYDFLAREPDPDGFQGWRSIMNNCAPGDTSCDRLGVSRGFFLSPEISERGYFIYFLYVTALGRHPSYAEFIPDQALVSGFLSTAELEQSKQDFTIDFMSRAEFKALYDGQSARGFVETLLAKAGVDLPEKESLINDLEQGRKTRAQVFREIAQSQILQSKHFKEATIVMHYFAYLRRDPDILYLEWLRILRETGDYRAITDGFVNSTEYRQRFCP